MERIKISDSEWIIMKVLWNSEGGRSMTLGDIVRALGEDSKWSYTTIRTLIVRLAEKKAVHVDKTTGVYRYSPMIDKNDCIQNEVKSFISKVFDDSHTDFFAALVKEGEISDSEREKIIRILRSYED